MAIGPEHCFEAVGVRRGHWGNAEPIRRVFRDAFEAAGLPYFNPHSLRSTLVQLGQATCRTPEDFKAWSQNLGHEEVLTTFYSYGQVGTRRQRDIIHELAAPRESRQSPHADAVADAVVRRLRASGSIR